MMEFPGCALADYYDAFNFYMFALRLRSLTTGKIIPSAESKDSKQDKIIEMIMLSLIGMSTCFYALGELRWGFESLDLLVFMCQNQLKPGSEMSNYVRDMLVFYDSKHNQSVFQLNEFERVLLAGFPGENSAEQFRNKIYQEHMERANLKAGAGNGQKLNIPESKGIHEIIERYRPSKVYLSEKINDWYSDRVKAQKELYFQSMRSKDKLSNSLDEETLFLFSKSTNISGQNIPSSPIRSPKRKVRKNGNGAASPMGRDNSISMEVNETSVDRVLLPETKSTRSRLLTKRSTLSRSKICETKPTRHSLDDLNGILDLYNVKLQDPALQPRKHRPKPRSNSIMATVFDNDGQFGITQYFRRRVLRDLRKDFKGSRGLDDASERQAKSELADVKFEDKFKRAKMISSSCKANSKVESMQLEFAKKESDPLIFDPQTLQRSIEEQNLINQLNKGMFTSKEGNGNEALGELLGGNNLRNMFGFENQEKQDFSKIEVFMRRHPKVFSINKLIAFKESISKSHPFYLEEQAKLEALITKEKEKTEFIRKVKAEGVIYTDSDHHQEC